MSRYDSLNCTHAEVVRLMCEGLPPSCATRYSNRVLDIGRSTNYCHKITDFCSGVRRLYLNFDGCAVAHSSESVAYWEFMDGGKISRHIPTWLTKKEEGHIKCVNLLLEAMGAPWRYFISPVPGVGLCITINGGDPVRLGESTVKMEVYGNDTVKIHYQPRNTRMAVGVSTPGIPVPKTRSDYELPKAAENPD